MLLVIAALGYVVFATLCCLKGKYVMAGIAFFCTPVALVGTCRVAKPESWWARKFYGYAKAKKSWERFESTPYPGTLPQFAAPTAGPAPKLAAAARQDSVIR